MRILKSGAACIVLGRRRVLDTVVFRSSVSQGCHGIKSVAISNVYPWDCSVIMRAQNAAKSPKYFGPVEGPSISQSDYMRFTIFSFPITLTYVIPASKEVSCLVLIV